MKTHQTLFLTIAACLAAQGALHAQILVSVGGPAATENFNSFGTENVYSLPSGWKGVMSATYQATDFSYASANLTQTAFNDPNPVTRSGLFNLGSGAVPATATDRALGFWVTSGNYTTSKTVVAMAHYRNSGAASINALSISYDLGKFRFGNVDSAVDLFYSTDGVTWTLLSDFSKQFESDGNFTLITSNTPRNPVTVSGTYVLPTAIEADGDFYLAWRYASNITTNSPTAMGAAIGLDNVSITAIPEPSVALLALPAAALMALRRRKAE